MAFLRETPPDEKIPQRVLVSAFTSVMLLLTALSVVLVGGGALLRAHLSCGPVVRAPHFAPPPPLKPDLRPGLTTGRRA